MRWRWFRVVKDLAKFPKTGSYKVWKRQLAEEGRCQCVYCAIHESSFGGVWNFHVEHYRPKSKFAALENDFSNLFYACAICNVFKGDDWPGEPSEDCSSLFYLNPSEVDYSDFFDVDPETGLVNAGSVAGKYAVEKIYLNRPQLIFDRRRFHMLAKLQSLASALRASSVALAERKDDESRLFLARIVEALSRIVELQAGARELQPYAPDDVKRGSSR